MGPAEQKPFSDDWAVLRERLRQGSLPRSNMARDKYVAQMESLTLSGVPVVRITPKGYTAANNGKVAVYLHGGGYTEKRPQYILQNYAPLAAALDMRVIAVDYRLAPEAPYPAALDDCYAVYAALLKTMPGHNIVLFGDSAGGSLVMSMLLKAKKAGLAMPAATAVLSPWSDITPTGDTYDTLAATDPVLDHATLTSAARAYVGSADPKDPLISPVYGSYSRDFPPTLIVVGTRDMFVSNAARLYRRLKDAGVIVELDVMEGMWHGFYSWLDLPEADVTKKDIVQWFNKYLA